MAAYRIGIPVLFRHQSRTAPSTCFLASRRHYKPKPTQNHDPRADKPWFQKLQLEKAKEEKKTLGRKIDEMFGLEPAIPPPKRDTVTFGDERVESDETNPLYKEKPVFMCVPRTNFHEGEGQAMWLTKAKPMGDGKMPQQIQDLAETVEIPDMEEKVHQAILHTRLYDSEVTWIHTKRYGLRQIDSLLRISSVLGTTYPELQQRATARGAYVMARYHRGDDLVATQGNPHALLMTSKNPLPALVDQEEVAASKDYELPSFYPISPTIDLIETNIYKGDNFTGFQDGYPFPHAHTLFMLNTKWQTDHTFLVSRGIMYAHAHAVTRAMKQHGVLEEIDLPHPIVVQCVASDGVRFHFIHFQLNTLRHTTDDGIKNMVWVDRDNYLFTDMYPQDIHIFRTRKNRKTKRSYIRKMKTRRDPLLGCQDLNVDVYRKFLACYVNGAVS
ncbi:large ribosomal subunit protein mL37-like [Amphiura filiformis]|uniref:large ribosomal subunit protein mL37-like n=1 Tax=Amphiura filiformis TaxID=82378 RepID=UPI003B20C7AA